MKAEHDGNLLNVFRAVNPYSMWGVFAVLALLPVVVRNDYYVGVLIICLIYATLASSWNLMVGYAGILSFGHQAFYGLGAYFSALITMKCNLSPWLGLPLGGLFAGLLSLAIGFPCLRLRIAPYVAIATLAFSEILLAICKNWVSLTRGEMGLWGIRPFQDFSLLGYGPVVFSGGAKLPFYYLMLGIFIVTMLFIHFQMSSKAGLALKSIREDQEAAASLGVDITRYKLTAFLTGSFFAGVTGSFYAHYVSILAPDAVFGIGEMVEIVAITLIGGIGTFFGPTLGSFVLVIGLELLRGLSDYRLMIYGALLVILIIVMPHGFLAGLSQLAERAGSLVKAKNRPQGGSEISRLGD
jgi:branched-chain amino acid transport system permease protein